MSDNKNLFRNLLGKELEEAYKKNPLTDDRIKEIEDTIPERLKYAKRED